MTTYTPAVMPTMYFIGVTTTKSSIMKVFPAWAQDLGLNAEIVGIDFQMHSAAADYREAVAFIKHDPLSLGALVTTHKLNLYRAAKDLFDEVGRFTRLLGEVSSISKRESRLIGHAKDPITSGLSLEAIIEEGYWERSGAELALLGAGGSALALTLYLHERAIRGADVPSRLVVTNRSPGRLTEMQAIHDHIGMAIPTEYHLAPGPEDNDKALVGLPPGSMVINATGLGKDRPGSPLTDATTFPDHGIAWDFNYRGDLLFLEQARSQEAARGLTVVDGWTYFIHGWSRVVAEVFALDLPS
jgi:shikimate dehydrogenase